MATISLALGGLVRREADPDADADPHRFSSLVSPFSKISQNCLVCLMRRHKIVAFCTSPPCQKADPESEADLYRFFLSIILSTLFISEARSPNWLHKTPRRHGHHRRHHSSSYYRPSYSSNYQGYNNYNNNNYRPNTPIRDLLPLKVGSCVFIQVAALAFWQMHIWIFSSRWLLLPVLLVALKWPPSSADLPPSSDDLIPFSDDLMLGILLQINSLGVQSLCVPATFWC